MFKYEKKHAWPMGFLKWELQFFPKVNLSRLTFKFCNMSLCLGAKNWPMRFFKLMALKNIYIVV